MARKTFVGTIYKEVKDPSLISRYRGIDDEDLKEVIGKIGKWSIDWNFDLTSQTHREKDEIFEQSHILNNQLYTESYRHNKMYATKLALLYPLGKGQLKLGTEDVLVSSQNRYSTLSDLLPNASSKVHELTLAAFTEYSLASESWGQWVVALRYEHVSMDYEDQLDSNKTKHHKTFLLADA